jgi:hypothetical protein
LANAASSLSKKSASDSDAANTVSSWTAGRGAVRSGPDAETGAGPANTWAAILPRECSKSSFTRAMTSCGSNGFASTPLHPAWSALCSSTGSKAPVNKSTGMCDKRGECFT